MTTESDDIAIVEMEVGVPDSEWFDDRLDNTRFDDPSDFFTQVMDEAAVIAKETDAVEPVETITVEVPEDAVETFEEVRDHFRERGEFTLEELLSFLLAQIYVSESRFNSL